MDHTSTLLAIAELAVALAGFASLISVIGRRTDDRARAIDSFRLRTMLEMALRYAAFALVPLPFLQIAPAEPLVWQASSGLYLVSTAVYGTLSIKRARAHEGMTDRRWAIGPVMGLTSISLLVNIANVLGLGGSNAFSLYLGALLVGLASAGLLFLSVVASVFRPER